MVRKRQNQDFYYFLLTSIYCKVIISRDINDLWDHALQDSKNSLAVFRNCKLGYKHLFDVTNLNFVHAGFQSCRCIFSTSIFIADLEKWKQNDISQQVHYWLKLNVEEPLFIGASLAPLLAVFYGNYQNLAETPYLTWNHTHSLGTKPQQPFNLTYIKQVIIISFLHHYYIIISHIRYM